MRRMSALLSIVLAACASGSRSSPMPPGVEETVRIANTGANVSSGMKVVSDAPTASITDIAQPIGSVWNALGVVYDSLGIPIATRDNATHVLGNPALKLRHRLGSTRLARFIDCGSTQGGPSADLYEIVLSVVSALQPSATGTTLATQVSAQGRPVAFSGEYVRCSSTGALEQLVANQVKLRAR